MPILPPLLGQPDIEGRVVLGVGGLRGGERVPEGFLGGFCWCGACLPWVAHILEASAIVFTVGVLHAGWVERGVPQRRGGGGRVSGGGGGQGGGGQEVEQHRGQD